MNLNIINLNFFEKSNIRKYARQYSLIIVFLVLCAVISFISPVFLLPSNLRNITIQIAINALLATGMTFVIITGGIDISVGSVAALGGIVVTGILRQMPGASLFMVLLLGFFVSIIVGILCGGFNAYVITRFKVAPFIATLGMLSIARGFAYVYTKSKPIFNLPETFGFLGQGYIGPIPLMVLLVTIIMLMAHILLDKTCFGRYIYAVGSDEEVAKLNGIDVKKTKFIVYILSGILSAFGGVCLASRLATGQPSAANGYELLAIAAVVMGGTSMTGGKGSIINTVFGLLTIGVINNGMSLMQISSYWQKIVMGFIIVLAVAIDKSGDNQ